MTRRAVVSGILCAGLVAAVTPYSDLVMRGTWIGLTAFPVSSFFVLLLLSAFSTWLPRRLGVRLSKAELLTIYCMTLVAAGVPSFGWTGLLIPYLAGPAYFASPENKWEQTLLPTLDQWLRPVAGPATTGLYEGLHPGEPIPWAAWATPLLAWTILATAVYACFFCLSALLRKRWVDDEKLVFPLVQLPLEMTSDHGSSPGAQPFLHEAGLQVQR